MPEEKKKRSGQTGHQKGSQFERDTCVRLSLWASGMTREDVFWRSAMSGGRATFVGRKKGLSKFASCACDISAVHELGAHFLKIFVVECKFWKNLCLEGLIYDRDTELLQEWRKTLNTAHELKRFPMLIAKQDRKKELILLTSEGLACLEDCVKDGKVTRSVCFPKQEIWCITFSSFLTFVSYDSMRERWRPSATGPFRIPDEIR